ncbi:MAG: hypothetical protein U0132_18485 [Gemmatimonadaceae bacterium]
MPLLWLASACGTIMSAEGGVGGEAPAPDVSPSIELTSTGGITALHRRIRIDSLSLSFEYMVTAICTPGNSCPMLELTTGVLPRESVDRLFVETRQPEFRSLLSDYGATADGADMMTSQLRVVANGVVRTVRADDGTMPTILAHYLHDIELTVRAARASARH